MRARIIKAIADHAFYTSADIEAGNGARRCLRLVISAVTQFQPAPMQRAGAVDENRRR
jgi:hypothetical protein